MKTFPLTLEEMRVWAAAQEPDAVVGRTAVPNECPCQRCIVELGKAPAGSEVLVYQRTVELGGEHYRSPVWLRSLVRAIDDWGESKRQPVTAARLLRFLNEVAK